MSLHGPPDSHDQGRRRRGGGGGVAGFRTFALLKTAGDDPQKLGCFTISVIFFLKRLQFLLFQHFQNKVAEIRGEIKFWGKWVWVPMNPSP